MSVVVIFEVLMYVNIFYYLMSGSCNAIITIVKYGCAVPTPRIELDAFIQIIIFASETLKLLLFQKFNKTNQVLAITLGIALSTISIGCLYYIFFIQKPILKLEIILDIMFGVLLCSEAVFGSLAVLYCLKRKYCYLYLHT